MLTTTMRSPGEEPVSEKHAYGCSLNENDGGFEIVWHECSNGAEADIRLTISAGEAVMHRTGETEGHLRFLPGSRQPGIYHTPYGNFEMVTDTHELKHLRDEKGGLLTLKYDLYQQHD